MTDVNRSPYLCPACTLKLTRQGNLFPGLVASSLLVILLLGYLWLNQVDATVVINTGGDGKLGEVLSPAPFAGIAIDHGQSRSEPGVARRRLAGQSKHGFIPVSAVDLILPDPYSSAGEDLSGAGKGDGETQDVIPGLFADTTTHTIGEQLQKVPQLMWMKRPDYPERAQRLNLTGKVLLHVLVSRLGNPLEVVVVTEDPVRSGFGSAAITAAQSAVFSPAVQEGIPVRCWVAIPLEFALE